jgi:hypothetical protein
VNDLVLFKSIRFLVNSSDRSFFSNEDRDSQQHKPGRYLAGQHLATQNAQFISIIAPMELHWFFSGFHSTYSMFSDRYKHVDGPSIATRS